jgi:ABC-type branched-subunit amino acid transport system substrate-binding protein
MQRSILALAAAGILAITAPAYAQKKYDSGASDTEIKLGQTMPYSGPASAYGSLGRTMVAYFRMINDQGGINGRRINLISLDDGYSPAKTLEATRRLVEQDEVLLITGSVGTPTNSAIHTYMNQKKVPHIFINTGAGKWNDPKNFPWTMGWAPTYPLEGRVFVEHILRTKPNAKIGILFQNDDFGKDYVRGVRERLGDKGKSMIVAEVSYEVTDPTVDTQVLTLKASGADVLINAASPKFAAQAIRRVAESGWKPVQYITTVSTTIGSVLQPAGLDRSTGLITTQYMKDPTDKQWDADPAIVNYKAFMRKYCTNCDVADPLNLQAYAVAQTMAHVLRTAGDNLTRENILRIASNLKDVKVDGPLPGLLLSTQPSDYGPLSTVVMSRFDGQKWVNFGEPISGNK